MKRIGVTMVVLLGLISCQHTDKKIINYIQSNELKEQSDYVVDLHDILGVEYDSMYLFAEYTNTKIAYVTGKKYSNWREVADSHNRIILFKNGDIIYEDDFPIRNMCFCEITERIDTTFSCIVHYSSIYKVNNIDGYYRLDLEKGKYPQYYQFIDSMGKQLHISYD